MRSERICSSSIDLPLRQILTQPKRRNKRLKQMIRKKRRCCVLSHARRHSRGVEQCGKVSATGCVKTVDQGSVAMYHCSAYWYCTDSILYPEVQILFSYPNAPLPIAPSQMRRLDHSENTKSESRLHVTLKGRSSHSSNVLLCRFLRAAFSLGCLASCTLLAGFAH